MTTDLTAEIRRLQGELQAVHAELSIRERQLERLDAENTRLRQENDDLSIGLGLADGPRRQIDDVFDVSPDLTAALLCHEVIA